MTKHTTQQRTPPVLYAKDDRIATITLNRPDTRNALADEMIHALIAAFERAEADEGVSCVILTGAGPSFCSGGNIRDIRAMTAEARMSPLEIAKWYRDGIQQIPLTADKLSVPMIAAINGHAIGAGCDLACMCDIRIAAEDAVVAESFLRVGLIPGDGGAWLLPRIVGMARASRMLFTGEFLDARKALDYGLVSEVVEPDALMDRAGALARMVAGHPPRAIRYAKRLLKGVSAVSLADNLEQAAVLQGLLQQLDDHREAVDAVLEKRPPDFTGS